MMATPEGATPQEHEAISGANTHRYARQQILPGISPHGQRRLAESRAVIVGCGALGCVAADWLARAGVGTLRLIDRDLVEPTNLQRQTLYDEADAGLASRDLIRTEDEPAGAPKAEAAARRLRQVNSQVRIEPVVADLQGRNAERLLELLPSSSAENRPSVILDGTDNFATRYLLNDLAVKHGIPMIYAGVVATRGMMMPIIPRGIAREKAGEGGEAIVASARTACLRCLFEHPPPHGSAETCDTAGVLGPAVGIAASAQAAEAIKVLVGAWSAVRRTLLAFDVWGNSRSAIRIDRPRSDCPCCAERRFDFLAATESGTASALCGQDAVQVWPGGVSGAGGGGDEIDLATLVAKLSRIGVFARQATLVRGHVTDAQTSASKPIELTVFADGRAIIRGTRDPAEARSIYARYVGT